jgi:hypothetical protein
MCIFREPSTSRDLASCAFQRADELKRSPPPLSYFRELASILSSFEFNTNIPNEYERSLIRYLNNIDLVRFIQSLQAFHFKNLNGMTSKTTLNQRRTP